MMSSTTPKATREKNNREAIRLIILFHMVGLTGFLVPVLNPIFFKLVPLHLLLMFMILVYSHQSIGKKLIWYMLIVFATAYTAEWVGVNRQWLFGEYYYGRTLGIKLGGIPLIIAFNWFLVTYSAGVLMQRSRLKYRWLRIVAGACLLVLLDAVIEPVAMHFDYWHWTKGVIPLKNYICWFAISGCMLWVFEAFRFKKQSLAAPVFLAVQFVFFTVLYFAVCN
jgi:putative membrane protein